MLRKVPLMPMMIFNISLYMLLDVICGGALILHAKVSEYPHYCICILQKERGPWEASMALYYAYPSVLLTKLYITVEPRSKAPAYKAMFAYKAFGKNPYCHQGLEGTAEAKRDTFI